MFTIQLASIIDAPMGLNQPFNADIYSALRDLASVPVVTKYNLIGDRERLNKALVIKPIFPSVIKIDFDDPKDVIQKYALIPGYFGRHFEPTKPRHIHIDIALSGEGNDRLGFSCAFISKFAERTNILPDILAANPLSHPPCAGFKSPKNGSQIHGPKPWETASIGKIQSGHIVQEKEPGLVAAVRCRKMVWGKIEKIPRLVSCGQPWNFFSITEDGPERPDGPQKLKR